MMQMMRGDAYEIAIALTDDEGAAITPSDVSDVEITLDGVAKTYAAEEVGYADGEWLFPVTQAETFALNTVSGLQVRVKYLTGDVVGAKIGNVYVTPSASSGVL